MNRIALFLCTQLAMAGLAAKTTQLTSTRELFEALKRGEPVRMVVHYSKCRLITGQETEAIAPDAVGGMTIGAFEYFAPGSVKNNKGFIAFSENTLIEHPGYGHVINYVKVRVYDDGAVLITAQYLKPATYELLLNESYSSSLHDGRKEKSAVYFYRNR